MRQKCWILASVFILLGFGVTPAWAGGAAWGTIKTVTSDKHQFVLVQDGNKEHLYTLTDEGRVRAGGKDGKLGDLKAGDHVVVLYFTVNKGLYAADVRQQKDPVDKKMTGQVKEVKGRSQFILTTDGKDYLITPTDDAFFNLTSRGGSIGDLKVGANVTVHYIKVGGGLYATAVETGTK